MPRVPSLQQIIDGERARSPIARQQLTDSHIRRSISARERAEDPAYRARLSENNRKTWQRPHTRRTRIAGIRQAKKAQGHLQASDRRAIYLSSWGEDRNSGFVQATCQKYGVSAGYIHHVMSNWGNSIVDPSTHKKNITQWNDRHGTLSGVRLCSPGSDLLPLYDRANAARGQHRSLIPPSAVYHVRFLHPEWSTAQWREYCCRYTGSIKKEKSGKTRNGFYLSARNRLFPWLTQKHSQAYQFNNIAECAEFINGISKRQHQPAYIWQIIEAGNLGVHFNGALAGWSWHKTQ